MALTLDEILAALSEQVTEADGDKDKLKAIADGLHKHAQPVAQALIDRGAGKKGGELKARIETLEREKKEAQDSLTELSQEFDEFKKKVPDAAAIEAKADEKWKKKHQAVEDRAKAAEERFRASRKGSVRSEFVQELIALGVDPDYAKETLGPKHDGQFKLREDDEVDILQLGGTDPLESNGDKSAARLLAEQVVKTVKPVFITAGVDSGGGVRSGTGGGGGGLRPEQVDQQKRNSGIYSGVL
jgi:hypothetical protein